MSELAKQGITDFKVWQAVVLRESVIKSINASHKMIVRAAKDLGWPYVVVCEDDLMFVDEGAWQYYLDNMPTNFDLYLACTYVKPISPIKVTGFHLYTVHEKFYDKFLSAPDDVHIDVYMDELNGDYRLCYPFPALQRAGFSANNSGYADYNTVLTKDDLYKKNNL
jgi:hypothetical protein